MSKPVLIISAHLDDAILSCGQFIEGRKGNVDILTVFSGIPDKKVKTEYDLACGFKNSQDAMVVRREEDREACAILNANPIHADLLDSQYMRGTQKFSHVINNSLKRNYEMILAPLGLRHPDHVAISDYLLSLRLDNFYLYEDLPHRVTHPELVQERFEELNGGWYPKLTFIGDGSMTEKLRALWCYKSQMGRGDLNIHNICVTERFHKV